MGVQVTPLRGPALRRWASAVLHTTRPPTSDHGRRCSTCSRKRWAEREPKSHKLGLLKGATFDKSYSKGVIENHEFDPSRRIRG
jgi:hypothetical protein